MPYQPKNPSVAEAVLKRSLHYLLTNPLSAFGVFLICTVLVAAIFADVIAPFPEHVGAVVDFLNFNKALDSTYLMGTDLVGRDLFSRILYADRVSLILGAVVLIQAVPVGVTLGVIAG